MRKVTSTSLLLLTLLVVVIILNAKFTSQILFSPKSDQASSLLNNPQTNVGKSLQHETTQLEANLDPALTSFATLENSTDQNLIPSPSPIASPQIEEIALNVVATPKPTPTNAIVSTTPMPTPKPSSPSATNTPTQPPVSPAAPAGSLSGDKIFDLTNTYRQSKGLSLLQKDERSCELARSRAPEIMNEVKTGTMHKGLADRNLPYWNNENIAYYNTEEETVRWWASDYIHRRQLEGNFKYSCTACYKNACAQELTNFAPK